MAYIFQEDDLPKLISVTPGRERTFFVNKELTKIDDMLAGVMHYVKGGSSPYHFHKNCEHFYFIMEGNGTVEYEGGSRDVGPGDMIFIPAEDKHRLRASKSPLFYFEFRRPIGSLQQFWMERPTICAGTGSRAECGCKRKTRCEDTDVLPNKQVLGDGYADLH